ncbi:ceramide-1-phosphate transfer protein-like [Oscarella lobularis]|uniref:ceramide-1-phosphate transfer protein-like n=1 Tax=Oscarella lobularis TaxID=121494 RepID=UPI0033132AFF
MGTPFDLSQVVALFERIKTEEGEILLQEYTDAYSELNKFFGLLGRAMTFVTADINEKVGILRHHLNTTGEPYRSAQAMIKYEVEKKLLDKSRKPPSGSRTLLRLHRALNFIIHFFEKLKESSDEEKLSSQASEAYGATLAHHHTWLIRKAVQVGLYLVPKTKDVLASAKETKETVEPKLKRLLELARPIYEITEKLYTDFDLHSLP